MRLLLLILDAACWSGLLDGGSGCVVLRVSHQILEVVGLDEGFWSELEELGWVF